MTPQTRLPTPNSNPTPCRHPQSAQDEVPSTQNPIRRSTTSRSTQWLLFAVSQQHPLIPAPVVAWPQTKSHWCPKTPLASSHWGQIRTTSPLPSHSTSSSDKGPADPSYTDSKQTSLRLATLRGGCGRLATLGRDHNTPPKFSARTNCCCFPSHPHSGSQMRTGSGSIRVINAGVWLTHCLPQVKS